VRIIWGGRSQHIPFILRRVDPFISHLMGFSPPLQIGLWRARIVAQTKYTNRCGLARISVVVAI
jgi:hypothetical protein